MVPLVVRNPQRITTHCAVLLAQCVGYRALNTTHQQYCRVFSKLPDKPTVCYPAPICRQTKLVVAAMEPNAFLKSW